MINVLYNKRVVNGCTHKEVIDMTNSQIILLEQIRLQEEGVLKYTGKQIKVFNPASQEYEMVDEIQPIHTYQAWKSLGYQVKKGQKAVAKFPVWKYMVSMSKKDAELVDETDTEHIEGKGKMYMKVAAFFTDEQVEPINNKTITN